MQHILIENSKLIKQVIYYLASFLPVRLVYGQSYRKAERIKQDYLAASDKNAFIERFTEKKLMKVISLARKTKFYHKNIIGEGIETEAFINKNTVVNAGDDIVLSKRGADLITTSGTSGKPMAFYINKNRRGAEWYWMTQAWGNVGFDINSSWRAVLRNHALGNKSYIVNPLFKEICFNNFALDDDYLGFITEQIKIRNIPFIHAYPSAAYQLGLYWRKNNCIPGCVKAFLCGSENILPEQKRLLQNELGIRMFAFFGQSEKIILAYEGETCENYHTNPLYSYAEIVDENGETISTPGRFGELVGTGYMNTKTPFVRYKTGDFAEYVGHHCEQCGHIGLTFKNVRGRWGGEKIYLSNGTTITTTSINLHSDIYTKIDGIQYYQVIPGELEIRIVSNENWRKESAEQLISNLEIKVPSGLKFVVKEVDEVEYTANRKYLLLIQKVNPMMQSQSQKQ